MKLKILSLQWQRKWLKPSPWHLQPNVLSAVYASEVQPVICQVFFIFFIKSQLLLAFYIAECLWKEVRAGEHEWSSSDLKQPFSSTFYWREETFLKIIYHLLHAVIHLCCMYTSSWYISAVWVLTAATWDIAAARCPLASSWQTRRECMPIADRAGLNWWPHPNPCIFVPGSGPCHGGRVFSKLKQAQVHMLAYGKPTAEVCVTTYRRSFWPPVLYFMFALTTGPSVLKKN